MAGYLLQPKVYKLTFEDHPGLEVMARGVSVEELLDVLRTADQMSAGGDDGDAERAMRKLFGAFAERLIGWNLETPGSDGDGVPIPATLDGLMGQDIGFAQLLVESWVEAITPGKSQRSGTPGTPPPEPLEGSIPMTPASESAPGT